MAPQSTPILETPRLLLRPLRLEDAPQIQTIFPHWEILEYMAAAIPWPYPDDGARTYLGTTLPKMEAGQEYDWAITLKSEDNDRLIGVIALYPGRDDSRGFWLGKDYHRQGLMTEAVCAVNDFAFDVLGLTHLTLNNAEPNHASHRLKEISGAKIVAIEDSVPFVGGNFRRVRWLLTREDWHAHRHLSQPSTRPSTAPETA